jgi:hypothetical protein
MTDLAREFWIPITQSEPHSPWQVRVELCIREIKKAVRHTMLRTGPPKQLWAYCMIYQCKLRNLITHPHFSLNGRTPYEVTIGRTPDISEYLDFAWYDTLWYYDESAEFPQERRKLGKWLGVVHHMGQALCYYILNENARVIVRSTVQALTKDEFNLENVKEQIKSLDSLIHQRIGEAELADLPVELQDELVRDYEMFEPLEPAACKPDIDVIGEAEYDTLISAEDMLPMDGILQPAKVTQRKHDMNGIG